MNGSLRQQIDGHAALVLQMRKNGATIRYIAERLYELGVHHPYSSFRNPVSDIGAAVRSWLNAHMSPVERIQDRIEMLENKLAEAEAELESLLSNPPQTSKEDVHAKWRARNQEIYDLHYAGQTYHALALRFNVSKERIRQIVSRCRWRRWRADRIASIGPKI